MILLVIDDDLVDRQMVQRTVRALHPDATILEADGAATAAAMLDRPEIDCVLLDYQLPGVDGLQVLTDLQGRRPDLPVVVLTGHGDQQLAVTLMKAGARDYLDKGRITPELLDQSIRHAIAIAAGERERRALLEREQEARREAQSANRAKDEFLATLSHELRTPLNAILGWARLLNTGSLNDDTTRRALQAIERSAVVQTKLIEDLLDISRIVTGKLQVDFQPLRLTTIATAVVEAFQHEAVQKGIVLGHVTSGVELPLMGDAARLQQVLNNLVANAVKFTPSSGRVDVVIEFEATQARVQVRDTGAGIDPNFLPYMFDRFRQDSSAAAGRHGGLGLGLAIVRHLVELHGGTVEAASEGPGRGALFEVRLPVASGATVAPPSAYLSDTAVPSIRGTMVLLVDDDPDARVLMRAMLERHGAIVEDAGSAADALALAARARPDVVVSDIGMPGEDGYTFIRRLRRLYADRRLGAIAVTAYASLGDRSRALDAGYDFHLTKPVDPAALVRTVAALSSTGDTAHSL